MILKQGELDYEAVWASSAGVRWFSEVFNLKDGGAVNIV